MRRKQQCLYVLLVGRFAKKGKCIPATGVKDVTTTSAAEGQLILFLPRVQLPMIIEVMWCATSVVELMLGSVVMSEKVTI